MKSKNFFSKILRSMFLTILLAALSSGCSINNITKNQPSKTSENTPSKVPNIKPENSPLPSKTPQKTPNRPEKTTDEIVQSILNKMTLEEKIGQVFMMSLRNLPDTKDAVILTDAAKQRIEKNHLGGIILFAENLKNIPQAKKLIEDAQSVSKYPMFIAVDEEGGAVSRLNPNTALHSTKLPTNSEIGSTGDPELAKKAGKVIAEEIEALGFNMDFAPIADVNSNPKNPVIGVRSFSSNPKVAAEMVEAEVEGMHESNMITVLKHFPGHGDTSSDTHTGAVIVYHTKKRLDQIEFVPFISGIKSGTDGIMTAHIQVPNVTHNNMPASLSKEIQTNILRNELNFKGLIITDSLSMGAISKYCSPSKAAILAFQAGADILLMPSDIEAAYSGFLKAVNDGTISKERLDESVKRILELKQERGILNAKVNNINPEKVLGCKEHLNVADEIYKEINKLHIQKSNGKNK